jgi:cell wall assembly regulator SMI1
MSWNQWPQRWIAALHACERIGGESRELIIKPPATDEEVAAVEATLGMELPASLRQVLTGFSSAVEFRWFAPDDFEFPKPFRDMNSGECVWSLARIVEVEQQRREWVQGLFSDSDDPYGRIWHGKLPVIEVGNGDIIALDLKQPSNRSCTCISQKAKDTVTCLAETSPISLTA